MKRILATAVLACALATGCAHPAYVSPVEVTRFTGAQTDWLAQGTIEIAAAPGVEADSLEFSIYREAVRRQLEALGYRVVAQDGDQVAQVSVAQFVAAPESGGLGRGVGLGVGGSTYLVPPAARRCRSDGRPGKIPSRLRTSVQRAERPLSC